ncbi:MAG: hypothetical protein DRP24_04215 [Thermotoga sp.]|nr:MAG: hypothetical protein DRP24_04215 [Thermotoga sp.]
MYESTICYPRTCLFEGISISKGRRTNQFMRNRGKRIGRNSCSERENSYPCLESTQGRCAGE